MYICKQTDWRWRNHSDYSSSKYYWQFSITCDEIIDTEVKSYDEETKTVTTNFNGKNVVCKTKNVYTLLILLLITIVLFIAASIYCYLLNFKWKEKHLLPYYVINDKLINDRIVNVL